LIKIAKNLMVSVCFVKEKCVFYKKKSIFIFSQSDRFLPFFWPLAADMPC